jgi:hypothetical protein
VEFSRKKPKTFVEGRGFYFSAQRQPRGHGISRDRNNFFRETPATSMNALKDGNCHHHAAV